MIANPLYETRNVRKRGPTYWAVKFDGTPECAAELIKLLVRFEMPTILYDQDPQHIIIALVGVAQNYWVHPGWWVLIDRATDEVMAVDSGTFDVEYDDA